MDNKKKLSLHVDLDTFTPATEEDKQYIVQMRESTTFFKDGVKRLLKNKVATVSLVVVVLITLAAIFVPMFWPYSYETQLGIVPGKPTDPSYSNLKPFEYGSTEGYQLLGAVNAETYFIPLAEKEVYMFPAQKAADI